MFEVWRARDGDRRHGGSFQFERLYAKVTPWRVILVIVGLVAYATGLAVFLPARAVLGPDRDSTGTVWRGQTELSPGLSARWTADLPRTLLALRPVADVTIAGPETALEGRLSWNDGLLVHNISGLGSLGLIQTLAPDLPVSCEGSFTMTANDLAVEGGAVGEATLRSGPAECSVQGQPVRFPALFGEWTSDMDASRLTVTGPADERLFSVELSRGQAPALDVAAMAISPMSPPLVAGVN